MNRSFRALLLTTLAAVVGCDKQLPLPSEPASLSKLGAQAMAENTYQSTDVPTAIRDNQTASSTILVGNSGYVTKVTVRFSINHTYDQDLGISLMSPSGKIVTLVAHRGADGHNFTNTVLDDNAATIIEAGLPPFTGTFIPDESLAIFAGESAQGTWTLRMLDDASGDEGTLTAWSLTLTTTDQAPSPPAGILSTFQSTDLPKSILNHQTATSTIQVPDLGTVTYVTVQFNIAHTFDGDMRISLSSPGGTVVRMLVDRMGGSGNNFTNTVLDDNGPVAITSGLPPYTGSFRPGQKLAGFNGLSAQGTWTLTVEDVAGGDEGSLTAWSLSITAVPSNMDPTAAAGQDQTVTRASAAGANVTLDGTGSSDSDGSIATYEWFENDAPIASGSTAQHVFALGTHTVTLRVTDDKNARDEDQVSITVENSRPAAAAGSDQTVTRTSSAGANVTLNGTASSDVDGTIATYQWFENEGLIASGSTAQHVFALGTHVVTLRVTDNDGAPSDDQVVITVENSPPMVSINPPLTLECEAGGARANFLATGADVDGNVTFAWSPTGATTAATSFFAPLGTTQVSVTVTDNDGVSVQASSSVTVTDTRGPVISMVVNPTRLWPPDHEMVKVATGISASDACGSSQLTVVVSSNEPSNSIGDGNTVSDWSVIANPSGTYDVYVRSERSGNGTGRVYTITATATDASGNMVSRSRTVSVPRDKRGTTSGSTTLQPRSASVFNGTPW